MKRACLLIISLLLLPLCGCWDYTETNQQTIVAGLSVDRADDGNSLEVGFETLPMPGGKEEIKPVFMSCISPSIEDAIRDIGGKTSFIPSVSHAWIMLISDEIARDGIGGIIDLIVTRPDLYMGTYLVVVKNSTAAGVFDCDSAATPIISYEVTNELLTDERYIGKTSPFPAYKIFDMLENGEGAYILPVISISEEYGKKLAVTDGGAVFQRDRLIGYLSPGEVQLCRIIGNQIKGGAITLDDEAMPPSLIIDGSSARLAARLRENEADIDIKLRLDTKSIPGKYDLNAVAAAAAQKLEDDINALIRKSVTMKCDFLGFARELSRYNPTEWERVRDKWSLIFPELEYTVRTDITIAS